MANQTIIEAAKAAYTREKIDVTGQVAAMAAISKIAVAVATKAKERTNKLNETFGLADDMKNEFIRPLLENARNNTETPYSQKEQIVRTAVNDDRLLTEWRKNRGKQVEKETLSDQIDPHTANWVYALENGSWFETTHDIDLNNDGDTDDEGERGLQPAIVDYELNRIKILNLDGEYVTIDDLPGSLPDKNDSESIVTIYDKNKEPPSGKNFNDISTLVRSNRDEISKEFSKNSKSLISFAYDQPLRIDDYEMITFVEYYLQNYLGEFSDYHPYFSEPETIIQRDPITGEETYVSQTDYEFDEEGKIIRDYDLLPKYNKIVTEYNKWIDGDELSGKEKKELGRNLFRSIIAAENIDWEEELKELVLNFIDESIEFKLKLELPEVIE